MTVTNPGSTTSFTGQGTVNPQKLFIPDKNQIQDPAVQIGMLQLERWLNSLQEAGFGKISHTYAVSGTIVVPSGATGYLPPFFMPVAVNQGTTLLGVMTKLRSGSCDLTIEQNGSAIATGVAVGTSPSFHAINAAVADNDYFQPVVTSVSSADGLTCSFYFAITQ